MAVPGPVPVQPGLEALTEQQRIALEKYIADQRTNLEKWLARRQNRLQRQQLTGEARERELRLSTSPIDFVAYELYRRQLDKRGPVKPKAPPKTNVQVQRAVGQILGPAATPDRGLRGRFGAKLPTTTGYTRSGFQDISPDELDILSSFLRAGVRERLPGGGVGKKVTVDPTEYFKEVEESFVPTLPGIGQPTRYSF